MDATIKHDEQAEAAYIKLSDAGHARTMQIDRNVLVDIDATGNVIGIEITGIQGIKVI